MTREDWALAAIGDPDDLACGCPSALPIVGGLLLGDALTAGWIVVTAWTVAHRPESWAWVRSAR